MTSRGGSGPGAAAVALWPVTFVVATLFGFVALSADVGFIQLMGGFQYPSDWVMAGFFLMAFALLGTAGWLSWKLFTRPTLAKYGVPEQYLDPSGAGWAWMFATVCGCATAFLAWFTLVV